MSVRSVLLHLGVVAAAFATGCGPRTQPDEPAADRRERKVLVIGIDGVRPDVLAELETPNLDRLIEAGTFSDAARTTRPTMSGPAWSSLLTGVWPAKHGVTGNAFIGKRFDRYPDFLTRIEQVRPRLHTFVALDWLPLGADTLGGPVIGDAPDVKYVVDGYSFASWAAADSAVVARAVTELRDTEVDAAFVYLGNPDEISHETHSIGTPYRDAIELADAHVGLLVAALRARPTYADEDWLVIVSTDHGRRADGGHGGDSPEETTIFYIVSGPSAVRGTPAESPGIVDVAATALTHLGIRLNDDWQLDGRAVGLRP